VSLKICESLRRIAQDFHEKKAEVFKIRNQPQMEKVFNEQFERIDAKVFAIRSEELGPYVSKTAKLDPIKGLRLRQQESYLRTQYHVMEFLGNLLNTQESNVTQAVLAVFKELSTYDKDKVYNDTLADLMERAFGSSLSECPDVQIDRNFVINISVIVNETRNKSINEARRIADRRANSKEDLSFNGLLESIDLWLMATENINKKITAFCERISLPQNGSQLLDPQLLGNFIKMLDRFPFMDLFDMSRLKDVPKMAEGAFARMRKEVLEAIKTFNQCEISSYESRDFFTKLSLFIERIGLIPFEVRKLQEKIAEVRNFLIKYE
jgi:hypothetical protein